MNRPHSENHCCRNFGIEGQKVREDTYRVSPISKAISIVFGISSDHGDESEAKQHDDKHQFS